MARAALPIGTERLTPQGYIRVRVAYNLSETGWILKHHLVAYNKRGKLHDPKTERVVFKDGDRVNFNPENIVVVEKSPKAQRTKEERIEDLRAGVDYHQAQARRLHMELEKLLGT